MTIHRLMRRIQMTPSLAGQVQELKRYLGNRTLMAIMCVDHVLAGLSREVLASIEALNARIVETLCLSTA
jgi:hypothetical protein